MPSDELLRALGVCGLRVWGRLWSRVWSEGWGGQVHTGIGPR